MAALALLVFYLLGIAGWCVYGAIVLSPFMWAFVALLVLAVASLLFNERDRIWRRRDGASS